MKHVISAIGLALLAFGAVTPVRAATPNTAPSFAYEVLPILSRAGCNQGTCHGNAEGRGGLKLSLKGEDPVTDYEALVRAGGGRRVSRGSPASSLLLRKASAQVAHGGGMRLRAGASEYQTMLSWIAYGAPMDPPDAPKLVRLEVSPSTQVLAQPVMSQRLTVRGRFSDGSVRDLTDRAVYNSGDPLVQVSQNGKVTFDRPGDVSILVRFADQMESARLTCIPGGKAFAWKPAPAVNYIDELNFKRLKLLRLQPSELADDATFLRRAYLDLLGTLPSPDEVRSFLAECEAESKSKSKSESKTPLLQYSPTPATRTKLVDQLLNRPEFAEYWAMKWADALRIEVRSLDPVGGKAYREWVRDWMRDDKPLDEFARQLLTSDGSTYKNPPANYYRRTRNAIDLGETTAQVFLGTRINCAKCHNHPFERWKQDDYYHLAAFFARVERKGELTRKDRFDLHELIGEETIAVGGKERVKHPRTGEVVAPRLPWTSAPMPMESTDDPRPMLAQWITSPQNPLFAKAMVNRIWHALFGKGLVDPVDDLRSSNPAANPELFEALTRDFVNGGFTQKRLIRTIMLSRTYQLSAIPNATNASDDRFFSRALPQRLGAEVLLDALSQVAEAPETFQDQPAGTRAVQLIPQKGRPPFLKTFGQPARESACACERADEPTLAQSFTLISGGELDRKLKNPDNRLGRLIAAKRTEAEIVEELYLASLSRFPTAEESRLMLTHVKSHADPRIALEDVAWSLINSKEFLLRR